MRGGRRADPAAAAHPPGLLWPLRKTVLVTAVAMVALPATLVLAGGATALVGGATLSALLLGVTAIPVAVAGYVVARRLGAGRILSGAVLTFGLLGAVLGMIAMQYRVLSIRGEELTVVVADKDGGVRPQNNRCTLAASDGTRIRPDLTGHECRRLEVGTRLRVVADPDGQVQPLRLDDYESRRPLVTLAIACAGVCGLLVPVAAVRGRARQRRLADEWAPPAYLTAGRGRSGRTRAVSGPLPRPGRGETLSFQYGAEGRRIGQVGAVVCGLLGAGAAVLGRPAGWLILWLIGAGAALAAWAAPWEIRLTDDGVSLQGLRRRHVPWSRVWSIEAATVVRDRITVIWLDDGTKLRSWAPVDLATNPDPDFDAKVAALQRWHRHHHTRTTGT